MVINYEPPAKGGGGFIIFITMNMHYQSIIRVPESDLKALITACEIVDVEYMILDRYQEDLMGNLTMVRVRIRTLLEQDLFWVGCQYAIILKEKGE